MKKNIAMALLTSFLLIGCGDGSSSNSNNQTSQDTTSNENSHQETTSNQTSQSEKLSPPNWIQGTWMDRTEPLIPTGWLFTSDDMYTIIGENSVSVTATLGSDDTITETKTDNTYEFTIHHKNSTETFKFKKINSTQIAYINSIDNTEVSRATKE